MPATPATSASRWRSRERSRSAPDARPARPGRAALAARGGRRGSRSTVSRPPGVKLDSGGLAKGLFADVLAGELAAHASFAVNCAGDLAHRRRSGPAPAGQRREPLRRAHPAHVRGPRRRVSPRAASDGAAGWTPTAARPTTCSTPPPAARRSPASCRPPRSLRAPCRRDPRQGRDPAAARRGAAAWLTHGGVIVFDDGSHHVIEPPRVDLAQRALRLRHAGPTARRKDE